MPFYLALLLQTYAIFNTGHNGIGWSEVATFYSSEALPHAKSSTGIPSYYWLHVGSNNIQNGQSGASIYAGVAPILAQAKANGSFVGVTQPWVDGAWIGTTKETEVNAYNALLATDPSCDFVLNGNTSFYGEGHLDPTQQSLYAQEVFNAMRAAGKV